MGIDWIITKQDSYHTDRVLLCNSEEEARQMAAEAIATLTADRMKKRRDHRDIGCDHELEDCVKSMQAIGMAVPADVAAAYEKSRKAAAATMLAQAQKKVAESQAELQKAQAEANALERAEADRG
jgi:hypothetical protein